MTDQSRTVAVAGSSPFALLLAGLLAADHSHSVVLLTDPPNPYELGRSVLLSAAPVTRPETWALVRQNMPPVIKRIARIAPKVLDRIDPVMVAHNKTSADGLRHIHHIASGFGLTVERPSGFVNELGLALMFRDCHRVPAPAVRLAMLEWLGKSGVTIVHDLDRLSIRRSGAGKLGELEIDQVILADDDAIRTCLGGDQVAVFAQPLPMQTILAQSQAPLPRAVIMDLDRGVTLSQRNDGALEILAPDVDGGALEMAAQCLPPAVRPKLAAQAAFTRLVTHDGAPVIGPVRGNGPYIIAGLESFALAFAPVVARDLLGTAARHERKWLDVHRAGQKMPRENAAELIMPAGGGLS